MPLGSQVRGTKQYLPSIFPCDISSVVVRMSRNDGSISITVLDDRTGEPISGANVVLMRGDSTDVISGTSGSDGIFAVAPIAAGRYIVEISHRGYAEQASPSYYHPRPGEDVAGTVRLHPLGGELTVTALNDTTDAPIAGANIVVVSNWGNGEQVATGITGSDGTFSTAWLPIGGYSVLVSHAELRPGRCFHLGDGRSAQSCLSRTNGPRGDQRARRGAHRRPGRDPEFARVLTRPQPSIIDVAWPAPRCLDCGGPGAGEQASCGPGVAGDRRQAGPCEGGGGDHGTREGMSEQRP